MRFLSAAFGAILIASGVSGQTPYTVENKVSKFTVVSKIPIAKPAPVREFWGGQWGWMEKGADGFWRQTKTPAQVVPESPFGQGTSGQPTLVPNADTQAQPARGPGSFVGTTPTGRTPMNVRWTILGGGTNCTSYG